MVDGVPFWGLWLNGMENDHHVRFVNYAHTLNQMRSGVYAPLDVEGGLLRTQMAGNWRYDALALENSIIKIGIGSARYYIKIARVYYGTVGGTELGEPFWTRTAAPKAATYEFQWAEIPEDDGGGGGEHREPRFQNVCAYTTLDSQLWKNQVSAVVFEGEEYDLATKDITPTPTANFAAWFNIACEGSLPAKAFLMRRTGASSDGGVYVSTIDKDRQALVRALAGEYCGNGASFTVVGHKLLIRDNMLFPGGGGWLPRKAPIGFSDADMTKAGFAFEAVWDANGAVCLDTPRMAVDDPNVPPDPEIENLILEHCEKRPPPCSGQSWFPRRWTEHGQLLTATLTGP